MEAAPGVEPGKNGVAIRSLNTWVGRHLRLIVKGWPF